MIEFIKESEPRKWDKYAEYRCDCGKIFVARVANVKSGMTKSCGCSRKGNASKYPKLYKLWVSIKTRCNPNNKTCKNGYWIVGISMCDEWKSDFMAFYNWAISNGYKEGLQIDRKNNDGNYEPSNCRFVTRTVNMQNTRLLRSNNTLGYRGVSFDPRYNTYSALVQYDKTPHRLGTFKTIEEAAMAYNNHVIANNTGHPLNIIQQR